MARSTGFRDRTLDDRDTPVTFPAPGKRTATQDLAAAPPGSLVVQLMPETRPRGHEDPFGLHLTAGAGVAGPGGSVPHAEAIQPLMPGLDLSTVRAHGGAEADGARSALGAQAYAMGNDIALPPSPSVHLVAHELAHVAQQRNGVSLKGGVGQEGDAHEVAADAVADRVAGGRSAADLMPDTGVIAASPASVQRKPKVEDRAIHRTTNADDAVTLHETFVDGKQQTTDIEMIQGGRHKEVPLREFHTDEKTLDPAVELLPASLPAMARSVAQDSYGDVPEIYDDLRTNKAQFVNAYANYMKLTNGGKDDLRLSKKETKRLGKASKNADVAEAMGQANDVNHALPAALKRLAIAQRSANVAGLKIDKALRALGVFDDKQKISQKEGQIGDLEREKEKARRYIGLVTDAINYVGVTVANTEVHWSNQVAENDTLRPGLVNFVTEQIVFSGVNRKIDAIRREIGHLQDGIVKKEKESLDDDLSIALAALADANDLMEAEWLTILQVVQNHRDAFHTAGTAIGEACGNERIGRVVEAIPYVEEMAATSSRIFDRGDQLAEHPHRGFAFHFIERVAQQDPQLGRKVRAGEYADVTEKEIDKASYSSDPARAARERAHLEDLVTQGKYYRDGLYVAFLVGIAERDTIGTRAGEFAELAKQAARTSKVIDSRIVLTNEK